MNNTWQTLNDLESVTFDLNSWGTIVWTALFIIALREFILVVWNEVLDADWLWWIIPPAMPVEPTHKPEMNCVYYTIHHTVDISQGPYLYPNLGQNTNRWELRVDRDRHPPPGMFAIAYSE